jgi:hypothetical protein
MSMNLSISKVRFFGDLERERVIIEASKDAEVGRYLVLRARSDGATYFGGKLQASFWFPDGEIKAGDLVVLYTKRGKRSKKSNNDGTTSHFFYWGLETPVWGPETAAVLVRTADWNAVINPLATPAD